MSTNAVRGIDTSVAPVDMKFEIVVIPVSDVDRAKEFYARLGWRLDADYDSGKDFRVIQFTPPGSGCSIIFGKNVTPAAPGSAQGLYLIVSDIQASAKSCSIAASRRNLRSIFCPTRKRFASSNPARSCTFSTNGPCAPASTPKKKSTNPRSTKSPSSARSIRSSPNTSVRPAASAPASPLPSAPKAPTSAASKSGRISPTSNEGSDPARSTKNMTRRGSLIYYLTAWICGCFFMSLAIWIRDLWGSNVTSPRSREAFGVLFFYFYGLVFGALAILIGALLLRRIMTLLKCKTPLHWAVAAAILAPLLVAGLLLTTNTLVAEEQTPWGGSAALMTEYGSLDEGLHQPSPDSSTPQSLGLGPSVG